MFNLDEIEEQYESLRDKADSGKIKDEVLNSKTVIDSQLTKEMKKRVPSLPQEESSNDMNDSHELPARNGDQKSFASESESEEISDHEDYEHGEYRQYESLRITDSSDEP